MEVQSIVLIESPTDANLRDEVFAKTGVDVKNYGVRGEKDWSVGERKQGSKNEPQVSSSP
jgi:hypothetical protein